MSLNKNRIISLYFSLFVSSYLNLFFFGKFRDVKTIEAIDLSARQRRLQDLFWSFRTRSNLSGKEGKRQ